MSKELREALEEYIEKIHQMELNAKDASLMTTGKRKEYWRGIETICCSIANDLTRRLKEDGELAKARVARIRVRGE